MKLLERIRKRAGSKAGGWDVFGWKNGQPLFMELKRRNSTDTLQKSQLNWMRAALAEGAKESAFQVVEWCGGSLRGRTLRLTSFFAVDADGWTECRNGEIIYSDPSKGRMRSLVDFYRNRGAKTNADLLWLVFVCNANGQTYCDIDEYPAKRRDK